MDGHDPEDKKPEDDSDDKIFTMLSGSQLFSWDQKSPGWLLWGKWRAGVKLA